MSAAVCHNEPLTTSAQLPDLLSFCSAFELRTNRHCRAVSQASERWLVESGVVLQSMAWRVAKPGLLAAACYPSTDPTQLRLIADVLSLLLHHDEWQSHASPKDDMFILLSDRLGRLAYKNPRWYMRFHRSQRSCIAARHQLCSNGVTPDLESYIELRRDASGFRMALNMIEYAGDLEVPETLSGNALFRKLLDHVCDIAAWSEDIVSCAKGISSAHRANIVTVLMKERNSSLDSALVSAGALVKHSVDAFLMLEESLLAMPGVGTDREAQRYMQSLRDWIAGFVNWLYETQLFLGEKGSEVRTFGWVFVPISP
ncbi:terpenoid synthase [Paxillus ammoniavirescens]|nr:terpenoid synthase [Paxillus ammoniavirescens]